MNIIIGKRSLLSQSKKFDEKKFLKLNKEDISDIELIKKLRNKKLNIIINLFYPSKKLNDNINIFETFYKPSNIKELDNNRNYVAFAGIGNSENFYNTMIESKLKVIKKFSFPDHYTYSNNDLTKILNYAKNNNAKVITTEKDYLRLNPNLAQDIKYLKLDLIIPDEKKLINILIKK